MPKQSRNDPAGDGFNVRFYILTPEGVSRKVVDATGPENIALARKRMRAQLRSLEVAGVPAALLSGHYAPRGKRLRVDYELNRPGQRDAGILSLVREFTRETDAIDRPRRAPTKKKGATRRSPVKDPASRHATVGSVLDEIRAKKPARACRPGFSTGLQLLATSRLQTTIRPHDLKAALGRFNACDWGDVPLSVARENNRYTHSGRGAIRARYFTPGGEGFQIVCNPPEGVVVAMLLDED